MPRTAYTPKNRFCFNSNLTEWAYLKVLYLWLRGETFSDIETLLPLENHQFDWIMRQIPNLPVVKQPIERDEPVNLSRQSCHRIIDQFAQYYMDEHIRTFRKSFRRIEDVLGDHPEGATYPAIKKLHRFLQVKSLFGFAHDVFKKVLSSPTIDGLNEQAWRLASSNIDHKTFQEELGLPSPATIIDDMALYLIQDRYRRFRGYSQEKMTAHTVHQMLTIQLAQVYYKRVKKRPDKNASDLSPQEIENWRTNIAMEALGYVVWKLVKKPVGIKAQEM